MASKGNQVYPQLVQWLEIQSYFIELVGWKEQRTEENGNPILPYQPPILWGGDEGTFTSHDVYVCHNLIVSTSCHWGRADSRLSLYIARIFTSGFRDSIVINRADGFFWMPQPVLFSSHLGSHSMARRQHFLCRRLCSKNWRKNPQWYDTCSFFFQ